MQEIEKRLTLLRLLLADITAKQGQLSEMESQYRAQLNRIVEFVVYREGDVANALSLMAEVQGKLGEVRQTAENLGLIATRATTEMEVLSLTKQVAEARSQLAELEHRQRELSAKLGHLSEQVSEPDAEGDTSIEEVMQVRSEVSNVSTEIARLNDLISAASEQAARMIQRADRGARH